MGILTTLTSKGSVLSNLNGKTGPKPNLKGSRVHYEYSINNNPALPNLPPPSILDLDGAVPLTNYRSNCPEGRTF